ncbi:hypothetical protein ACX3VG_32920, partial [Escherichia coli]
MRWVCLRDKPESCLCIHQPDIASVPSPREISPLDHIYFMSGVLFSRYVSCLLYTSPSPRDST